jgi:hypothetical protein
MSASSVLSAVYKKQGTSTLAGGKKPFARIGQTLKIVWDFYQAIFGSSD